MSKLIYGEKPFIGSSTTSNSSTLLSYPLYMKPSPRYKPQKYYDSFSPATPSSAFNDSLRSSDSIMSFVREFMVEFMEKVDSTYKFVKRNHFDQKMYCETEDGDFITIGDLFDKQLKQEQDEENRKDFARSDIASVV